MREFFGKTACYQYSLHGMGTVYHIARLCPVVSAGGIWSRVETILDEFGGAFAVFPVRVV
jgi:hypothetical protein